MSHNSILPVFLACTAFFHLNPKFSVAFRAGFWLGRSKTFLLRNHSFVDFLWFFKSPSCSSLTQHLKCVQDIFVKKCLVSCSVHWVVNAYYFPCSSCNKAPPLVSNPSLQTCHIYHLSHPAIKHFARILLINMSFGALLRRACLCCFGSSIFF